ncbi:Myb-like DNA-binding domain containing protein [Trichomonas vaginalis G3]|uniref:Myb-like DNA-binding domain containing protein n=1 Tax=Trichomonas vaginalis (strain ATCC PRA-98 / G3) TaxID=412133 RepID=A2EDQ7_TRIV3|nr:RNA polymerase II transcription regulator recruiting protein [Trichomonas vaginalis G3]EAY09222.1 Myb-like DNA-binding domain containing protein [Trichomonas vaginalis G3]KAI5486803.1 RNA polymerase II transcription regulator recruiting protein [Trichomonas vaginalis G3]|eukprot:XP_001321445.1 Myb-like DNA-binding domain containing protein [Trichomonas vaginalis G3]
MVKFSEEEDRKLIQIVQTMGTNDWKKIAAHLKTRNARQCRERWNNYINPDLNESEWTVDEDELLIKLQKEYGTAWNKIAKYFDKRSDNALRNRWMRLKRLLKNGSKGHPPSINPKKHHSSDTEQSPPQTKEVKDNIEKIVNLLQTSNPADLFGEENLFAW